jgi:hypothetical protein
MIDDAQFDCLYQIPICLIKDNVVQLFTFCAAESYDEVIVDSLSDWSTFLSKGSLGNAFVCGSRDYVV